LEINIPLKNVAEVFILRVFPCQAITLIHLKY